MSKNLPVRWLSDFILEVANVAPWSEELIETSEIINKWSRAKVLNKGEIDDRSNDVTRISWKIEPKFSLIEEKIKQAVSSVYGQYCKRYTHIKVETDTGYDLLRYRQNQYYNTHTDNMLIDPISIDRQLSIVFFLNDDYAGGELFFPIQNLKIKGKANSAIIFPSNFCYPHASVPVTNGIKYSLVTWLSSSSKILEKLGYNVVLDEKENLSPENDDTEISELI